MSRTSWWLIALAFLGFLGLILFLTHDIIITNILAYRICKADPNPKTFIKKTVEYPESIYWEDNIYPGFDENDRLLMICNYLDGAHLKTMALNAPDGTIYVYTATQEDWRESEKIQKKTQEDWKKYFNTLDKEAREIAKRARVYSPETMPCFNYSIVFDQAPLTSFERRYLWSDEVKVTELKTGEIVAYNRRLMRRFYMMLPDFVGHRYFSPTALCGEEGLLYFDEKVFTKYGRGLRPAKHKVFIENRIFTKENYK
ncbi:hypothetical protein [uncultured Desulfuromonas sp.]|uniref:hypothetical protein n=1 Tax=uncultured Desulfuromonas sp. TaxID=181013 RepID=UPI002AAC49F8|nr:hypothetical protein [uncultured Desulfuromonas sp.]